MAAYGERRLVRWVVGAKLLRWWMVIGTAAGAAAHGACAKSIEADADGRDAGRHSSATDLTVGSAAEAIIDGEGGVIELEAFRLEIPPHALDAAVTVRVTVTEPDLPTGFEAHSAAIRFEPSGLRFATPARVTLRAAVARRAGWLARPERGAAYRAIPRAASADGVAAHVAALEELVVASACEGGSCCDAPNGEVDLVVLVDGSNSMADERMRLANALPEVVRRLALGDTDGDGRQDVPGISSLRVAVLDSDLGAFPGVPVPTCTANGSDGRFIRGGVADPSCGLEPFVEVDPASSGAADVAAQHVQCALGAVGRCGFEQPLESLTQALTPTTSSLRFGGAPGHGDGANEGFLRAGSTLAVVVITDEDDCSTSDPALFEPQSERYGGELNVRCVLDDAPLYDPVRHVDGLLALRADARDLVMITSSGIPVDAAEASWSADDLLADARMRPTLTADGTAVASVCESMAAAAMPSPRLVQFSGALEAAGATTVRRSICEASFEPVSRGLLGALADRASGACASE